MKYTWLGVLFILVACSAGGSPDVEGTRSTPVTPPHTPVPQAPADTSEPAENPTLMPESTAEGTAEQANADVEFVRAVLSEDGTWTFHVTVSHPDTGWEDYADGWDVVTPDGEVLKPDPDSPFTRLLLHPHENEQPFTRSQSRLVIPPGIVEVRVRAHDLVHGFGGAEVLVNLETAEGPGYVVVR